jgi:arabinogalactan oligomer/maltooligosaccharide transport system substrate-binding protein
MLKLISLISLVTLLLAACGGTTSTTGGATSAPAPAEATAAAPAPAEATSAPAPAEATAAAPAEPTTAAAPAEATSAPVAGTGTKLVMWTKEGGSDLEFVKTLAKEFGDKNGVSIEVVNKDVETLRTDFQTAALAGSGPDLLWTVNDHAGPFTVAGIIASTDEVGIDTSNLVKAALDAVTLDGKVWGVPISAGNQLLLLYNKKIIKDAPKTTDELISVAKANTDAAKGTYGFVYNQTEPFWMVPWLGGFGGTVFKDDGKTPNLDTPEMVNTLKFLKDLKDQNIVPSESDYNTADALFQEGKAAMIVNGDWSLSTYAGSTASVTATKNLELGVAPMPTVSSTNKPAAPYTSGVYFMFPKGLSGDKLDAVKKFVEYVESPEVQTRFTTDLKRLPALQSALTSDTVTKDPILSGAANALPQGAGMPAQAEMRCNWDAMKPQMQAVLAGTSSPEDAAKEMQASADTCVKDLK